jgi:hypothetical protein
MGKEDFTVHRGKKVFIVRMEPTANRRNIPGALFDFGDIVLGDAVFDICISRKRTEVICIALQCKEYISWYWHIEECIA